MRWFSRLRRHESEPERVFTGNCMVRIFTGDGAGVGPCWHATYNCICPSHGDVSCYLTCCDLDAHIPVEPWPADYQLSMYDGNAWAERMRARQENHKRGNGF